MIDYIPEQFNSVEIESYQQVDCSPEIPSSSWSGIIISAPEKVIPEEFGETLVVPICGYYLVSVLDAMKGPPLSVNIKLADTDVTYTAPILAGEDGDDEPDIEPPEDAPVATEEELEGVQTGGYFNVDIVPYLADQLFTGKFDVTFSYAGSVSEPVRIEIVQPKNSP